MWRENSRRRPRRNRARRGVWHGREPGTHRPELGPSNSQTTAAAAGERSAGSAYAPSEADIPLRGYAGVIATFGSVGAVAFAAASRRGLPERIRLGDLLLLSVAAHHAARLVTKDKVTSVARAPFTEYEGSGDPSEVEERPRGQGVQKAVGELLTCPYCIGQWFALAGVTGVVLAPRTTRLVASVLTVSAASDYLQVVHRAVSPK
jgi:uncharacterized protein DUF1360